MTDTAGKAITVLGAVEPDRLGFTLMHEHLYLDLRRNHLPGPDLPPDERAMWEADLDLPNLHMARCAAFLFWTTTSSIPKTMP